jgi:hypothetical protein
MGTYHIHGPAGCAVNHALGGWLPGAFGFNLEGVGPGSDVPVLNHVPDGPVFHRQMG